ncbi:hypothetical protein [Priestia filamentosa]|uniref:hypothetical protein n=1 Tax=Priestia filamentosa TaxID=1402861 RepID=UPI001C1E86E6|nr:hypothetical protein [Priestia filamentosa]
MTLLEIKKMLFELTVPPFSEAYVTKTLSSSNMQILSVCYSKPRDVFQIAYMTTEHPREYRNLDQAANHIYAIMKASG